MKNLKSPRLSIFVRILLATLLPLIVIFSIVIFTINRVVYRSNIDSARERTVFIANQATAAIEASFESVSAIVAATAGHLSTISDSDDPLDRERALEFVKTLLVAGKQVYCGWLIMENGHDPEGVRKGVSFVRLEDGGVSQPRNIPDDILNDPSKSPWYTLPFRTGKPFVYTFDMYDYRTGKGAENNGIIAYPVMRGNRALGVVGVDLLYHVAFDFLKTWEASNQRQVLLLSEAGTILYSSDPALLGKNYHDINFEEAAAKTMADAIREKGSRLFEAVSPFSGLRSLHFLTPVNLKNADRALYLMSEVPVAAVYRNAERTYGLVAAASVLGMLLLAASVYLATRNIVKPIKKLTRSAEWIANGKLDVVLDDFGDNRQPRHEVDQLEMSLKKMLEGLNEAHELRLTAMEAEYERDRLEQSAGAKERFFANMSHEIRTPMNAVLGMSELLLRERLSHEQRKYVKDIKVSSESLIGIINDILDLSKLESGKFPLYNIHYDLRSMLEHVNSMCGFLAKSKRLRFTMDVADTVPRYLYGDALRVKQVLMNVIGNAIKFTDRGSVQVAVDNEGDMLSFSILDTGRGIRDEDMPHLFQPFTRFEKEGKSAAIKGTGLGLSITAHLLELMGGSVEVESEFGRGSVFRIRVPLVPGDPAKVEIHDEETAPGGFASSARVLAVDDNQINLDVAAGIIGLFGIACDKALSGPEAIRMVQEHDYDIVFMDHMMPGMDGIETTENIRKLGGKHERQIIVALTANAVIGTREKLLEAGMNDFLSKPIVRTDLQRILARWIPEDKQTPVTADDTASASDADGAGGFIDLTADDDSGRENSGDAALVERLRGVDGLAVDEGLDRVSGMVDLYTSTLEAVEAMRGEVTPRLRESLAGEDGKSFAIDIHGVKGALASVGANALSKRAAEMEQAAKEGNFSVCRELLPGFLADFAAFTERLGEALAQPEPAAAEEAPDAAEAEKGGGEELFVGLSELRVALLRLDAKDARELLDALSVFDFGPAVNAGMTTLSDMVDRGDLTGAASFVDELMKGVD